MSRVRYADGEVPLWVELTPDVTAPLVVWFHGNAEQAGGELWYLNGLLLRGVSFAAAEYPGYGLSTGAGPSEGALVAAAHATIAALPASTGPVVCVGESLGTGVAATMAAESLCAKLVLVSPYTSLPRVAQHAVPWLPGRLLVLDRFDTLGRAANISVPTLILHGDQDEVVPVEMGRALAAAFPAASLVERPGRGHNDIVDDELFDRVAEFARRGSTQQVLRRAAVMRSGRAFTVGSNAESAPSPNTRPRPTMMGLETSPLGRRLTTETKPPPRNNTPPGSSSKSQ